MRILHVISSLYRGGAENHLVSLVRHQVRGGHVVAIAYLKGIGHWTADLVALGIEVHPLRVGRYGLPRPIARLRQTIDAFAPDVVHAHMPPSELYARVALIGRRAAFVISKHNDEPFARFPGQRLVARWCAARAHSIICISNAVAQYVGDTKVGQGIAERRLEIIRYGLDPVLAVRGSGAGMRRSFGIPQEAMLVASIARLVPQKGLDTLLTAFAQFRRTVAPNARLLLVGVGPLESGLKNLAATLGVADATHFAGFRVDIPAILDAVDVFALASRWEGFGLVLLEAMAARRPIVATRVSAIPEVVGEGPDAAGELVPVDDIDALAAALARLVDPAVRERVGETGYARLVRDFSASAMAEKTDAVYRAALGVKG